jgi:sRNA-binding protein
MREECKVFQQLVPLKIKIHLDLIERYPHIAKHVIRGALHEVCKDVSYIRKLTVGAHRYDLDMNPVDVVNEDQFVDAKSRIRMLMAKLIKPR